MTLYKWSQLPAADATADPSINWQEGQAPSSVGKVTWRQHCGQAARQYSVLPLS